MRKDFSLWITKDKISIIWGSFVFFLIIAWKCFDCVLIVPVLQGIENFLYPSTETA